MKASQIVHIATVALLATTIASGPRSRSILAASAAVRGAR